VNDRGAACTVICWQADPSLWNNQPSPDRLPEQAAPPEHIQDRLSAALVRHPWVSGPWGGQGDGPSLPISTPARSTLWTGG